MDRRLAFKYADKLRQVNEEECRVCEKTWISKGLLHVQILCVCQRYLIMSDELLIGLLDITDFSSFSVVVLLI